MHNRQWLAGLFTAIDAGDPDKSAKFTARNAMFRFGNVPAVQGREAIWPIKQPT